jgi:hypothetical protein
MPASPSRRRPPARSTADEDTPLGRPAETRQERRAALEWCLNNVWAALDLRRVERVETARFHGWRAWRKD